MTLDEAIKRFESVQLYKNFEEFIEDCGDSRVKDGVKICGNPVNSLLFRGYGICDEDHCPDYKRCVERAEEHRQLAKWLEELKQLREQTWSLDDAREDFMYDVYKTLESLPTNDEANRIIDSFDRVTSGIRQEPCEMTAEEYRQRMIQAFHNAECDELITICVLPTEKEFEHLEWLLKNHYKKELCEDAIDRQAVLAIAGDSCLDLDSYDDTKEFCDEIKALPPVIPKSETVTEFADRCRECGAKYGKLLKQSEDAISRQKTIRRIKEQCNPYGMPTIDFESGKKVIKILKQTPPLVTVLPTQKTGRWIRFKNNEHNYYHIKCSECGQYWSIDGHSKVFKYCFNCGAKMVEPQERSKRNEEM